MWRERSKRRFPDDNHDGVDDESVTVQPTLSPPTSRETVRAAFVCGYPCAEGVVKFLLCHNRYQQPGGEDQVFEAKVELLRSRGHEVITYTLHNDAIHRLGSLTLALKTLWNRESYRQLRDVIRRERPALMHCTNVFPLISPAAYYAALADHVPVVQSLHNFRLLCANALLHRDGQVCEECLGKLIPWNGVWHGCYRDSRVESAGVAAMVLAHRWMGTWSKAVTRFITPSEFTRHKFIQAGFPADKIVAKPNFVASNPPVGFGAGNFALFVGRLAAEKGLNCLLDAWKRIPESIPLKIVGDGPLADRVRLAAADDSRIEWLGRQSSDDVLRLAGEASFVVVPSTCYETFGRIIVESYAVGTPVLVARHGAMAELLDEGRTGFGFTPGDAADLARQARRTYIDTATRGTMRTAARDEFLAKYTAEKNYEQLMTVYRAAIDSVGARTSPPRISAERKLPHACSPLTDSASASEGLNLLYTASMYPPSIGGAQLHLHCLAKQMQQLGNRVRVITHSSRNRQDWVRFATFMCEPREDFEYDGVPVHRLGYSAMDRLRMFPSAATYYANIGSAVKRLSRIVRGYFPEFDPPPSLIHCSRIGREFIARASLDYARELNIPFVLTPNHHSRWRGWLYREYDKIYREADALIALTEAERELLIREKEVAPDRVFVTGIGPVLSESYDAQGFRERYGIHSRFVLWVGQQHEYKGLGAIVAAAKNVWRTAPDVHFVFVGPPTKYSRRLFSDLVDTRFHNLGSVDLETKTSAIAAAEMLVLPSRQESFGGVYVEGWTHRKPVIGGRIPQIACVIDEGKDGLLTSQAPAEVADCIAALLHDAEGARVMGQRGWEKVQRLYTHERLAQRTLDIYRAAGVSGLDISPAQETIPEMIKE